MTTTKTVEITVTDPKTWITTLELLDLEDAGSLERYSISPANWLRKYASREAVPLNTTLIF